MSRQISRFYTFGPFRLDPSERVLLSNGQRILLTPKAFDTLLVLVERNGHVLGKDELLKIVWPDTFVEEGTLAQNISTIRKALGDGQDGQTYIETVPKRGYRFVAPVSEATDVDSGGVESDKVESAKIESGEQDRPEVSAETSQPMRASRSRSATAGSVIVLLILLAGVSAYFLRQRYSRSRKSLASPATLAVLPFENLSGKPEEQYFANGFTEEMITRLGDLDPKRLGIIARVSGMQNEQYQGAGKNAREIGQELGADYILQGSVTRDGGRVRITARLIQAKKQTTLWTKDYDREVRDILSLQSDVAGAIAREIELKLSPEESARLSATRLVDPDAYELYLKGRYFWNKRTEAAYEKAIEYFNQAIARDPQYARAYSGLADAYALLGSRPNAELPRREAMPRAKAAALTALKLDDSIAEAHASLAFVEMHYEWNWPASEQEFKSALELNPNYATAHEWFAYWLMAQGRPDESIEEINRAQRADPLSVIIKTDSADLLEFAGRFDEAIQKVREAMDLDPDFRLAHYFLGEAYMGKKMYSDALAEYQKGLALDKGDVWCLTGLGRVYANLGQKAKASKIVEQFHERNDLAIETASILAALGKKDQSFAWLEKAYLQREGGLILLNADPGLKSLRPDPRFADLARRVGLPPLPSEH